MGICWAGVRGQVGCGGLARGAALGVRKKPVAFVPMLCNGKGGPAMRRVENCCRPDWWQPHRTPHLPSLAGPRASPHPAQPCATPGVSIGGRSLWRGRGWFGSISALAGSSAGCTSSFQMAQALLGSPGLQISGARPSSPCPLAPPMKEIGSQFSSSPRGTEQVFGKELGPAVGREVQAGPHLWDTQRGLEGGGAGSVGPSGPTPILIQKASLAAHVSWGCRAASLGPVLLAPPPLCGL